MGAPAVLLTSSHGARREGSPNRARSRWRGARMSDVAARRLRLAWRCVLGGGSHTRIVAARIRLRPLVVGCRQTLSCSRPSRRSSWSSIPRVGSWAFNCAAGELSGHGDEDVAGCDVWETGLIREEDHLGTRESFDHLRAGDFPNRSEKSPMTFAAGSERREVDFVIEDRLEAERDLRPVAVLLRSLLENAWNSPALAPAHACSWSATTALASTWPSPTNCSRRSAAFIATTSSGNRRRPSDRRADHPPSRRDAERRRPCRARRRLLFQPRTSRRPLTMSTLAAPILVVEDNADDRALTVIALRDARSPTRSRSPATGKKRSNTSPTSRDRCPRWSCSGADRGPRRTQARTRAGTHQAATDRHLDRVQPAKRPPPQLARRSQRLRPQTDRVRRIRRSGQELGLLWLLINQPPPDTRRY